MNKKFAALYFASIVTAGTILLSGEATGQSEKDVQKAIEILKEETPKKFTSKGVDYVYYAKEIEPCCNDWKTAIYYAESDTNSYIMVKILSKKRPYMTSTHISDYVNNQADGIPDKYKKMKTTLRKAEDFMNAGLGNVESIMKKVSDGTLTTEMKKEYKSAIENLIKGEK